MTERETSLPGLCNIMKKLKLKNYGAGSLAAGK
jgi:hypothetical protein